MTINSSSQDNVEVKPWKVLSTSIALNEPWFPVRKDQIQLPSGTIVDDYFVWKSPHIATIAPLTAGGKFVICEQYRHGIGKNMYQFPAGGLNKNETPAAAAKRELEEETGYVSTDVTFLLKCAAFPTKASGFNHLFFAKNAKPTGTKQNDKHEPTRVLLKTPAELIQLMENGEFEVAGSLAAALLVLRKLGL